MLALNYFSQPAYNSGPFRRSPLGLRDANDCSANGNSWASNSAFISSPPASSSFSTRMSHFGNENEQLGPHKRRLTEPRKREGKFASLLRKKDDSELRRNAYLQSARRAGDDKLFAKRWDQNLRREFFEEQRELQARQEAEEAAMRPLEEEEPEFLNDTHHEDDRAMLEPPSDDDAYQQYLWSQDQMNMSQPSGFAHDWEQKKEDTSHTPDYWSDDDEFEQYLLEAATKLENGLKSDDPNSMDTDMMS